MLNPIHVYPIIRYLCPNATLLFFWIYVSLFPNTPYKCIDIVMVCNGYFHSHVIFAQLTNPLNSKFKMDHIIKYTKFLCVNFSCFKRGKIIFSSHWAKITLVLKFTWCTVRSQKKVSVNRLHLCPYHFTFISLTKLQQCLFTEYISRV